MKTKAFQSLLKVWIAIASVVAFLFGWIVLGHSGKPATASAASTDPNTTASDPASAANYSSLPVLPTLTPLQSSGSNFSLQPLQQSQQPSFNFLPSFRTRGS